MTSSFLTDEWEAQVELRLFQPNFVPFNPRILSFVTDFAQLLKILLKAQGLEVFLDVDNLANTGAFDDQLWKHLSATKNVVLVWTKGCMDRFLGAEDVGQQDFVRKEYVSNMFCRPFFGLFLYVQVSTGNAAEEEHRGRET